MDCVSLARAPAEKSGALAEQVLTGVVLWLGWHVIAPENWSSTEWRQPPFPSARDLPPCAIEARCLSARPTTNRLGDEYSGDSVALLRQIRPRIGPMEAPYRFI